MNRTDRDNRSNFLSTVVAIGGMWGLAEATLGFGLHALARLFPMPNLAGAIMFPIALFFMVLAIRRTGNGGAALAVAVVAASIKVSSLLLPAVTVAFVRSPVLAILAEGAVVTVASAAGVLRLTEIGADADEPAWAFSRSGNARIVSLAAATLILAVTWRALFLGMNIVLGITGGIMSKPLSVLVQFVTVESLWNAGLIAAVAMVSKTRSNSGAGDAERNGDPVRTGGTRWLHRLGWTGGTVSIRPLWTVAIFLGACVAEWGTNLTPL